MKVGISAILLSLLMGCAATQDFDLARKVYESPPELAFTGSSTVPLSEGKGGRLYVEVSLAGEKCIFIVDTGAVQTIISSDLASKLSIEKLATPKGTLYGGGGGVHSSIARIPVVEIGDAILKDLPVFITDLDEWNQREQTAQQTRIDGILGSEALLFLRASINYATKELVLHGRISES